MHQKLVYLEDDPLFWYVHSNATQGPEQDELAEANGQKRPEDVRCQRSRGDREGAGPGAQAGSLLQS